MGKSKGTLGLLSLLGAVTAQAGAFSLGWGPKPCLAEPPPAPNPTGVGKHVPSPKGCWQRDASSSLCLKAVKINLFLKSSPETLSWSPPQQLLHGSWGLGRPRLRNPSCGSSSLELKDEDAAGAQPGCPQGVWQRCPPCQPAQQPPARRGCSVQKEPTNGGVLPPKMLRLLSVSGKKRSRALLSPGFIASPWGRSCSPRGHPPTPPCSSKPLQCERQGCGQGEAAEPAHMLPNREQ